MKTLRPRAPHEFRWRTHYRKCPRRGSKREEEAVEDAPNVGAAAVATGFGGLGVVTTPAATLAATLAATPAASSTSPLAVRISKRQLSSHKDYAALAGIKRREGRGGRKA